VTRGIWLGRRSLLSATRPLEFLSRQGACAASTLLIDGPDPARESRPAGLNAGTVDSALCPPFLPIVDSSGLFSAASAVQHLLAVIDRPEVCKTVGWSRGIEARLRCKWSKWSLSEQGSFVIANNEEDQRVSHGVALTVLALAGVKHGILGDVGLDSSNIIIISAGC